MTLMPDQTLSTGWYRSDTSTHMPIGRCFSAAMSYFLVQVNNHAGQIYKDIDPLTGIHSFGQCAFQNILNFLSFQLLNLIAGSLK
jgi:hypothetical protein